MPNFAEDLPNLSELSSERGRAVPFEVVSDTFDIHRHSIYLSEAIGDPIEYVPILSSLRAAHEHDEFVFYLNTEGGQLATGLQLINAIRDTAARVTMVLDPQAYSMGALLFLTGHELVIPDGAQLMFHNYSGGVPMGKGHEQLAEVQAAMKSYERVLRRVCLGFLTDDEIKGVMSGQDVWLDSEEIRERLAKMKAPEPATAVSPPRARKKPGAKKKP